MDIFRYMILRAFCKGYEWLKYFFQLNRTSTVVDSILGRTSSLTSHENINAVSCMVNTNCRLPVQSLLEKPTLALGCVKKF